ncbi:membrane protein [Novosphingobium barchaimii LL02]|uniref:Membrane protein n=1 Tax=Novosphingobium barchaimii LL02 TaxID=1114963 RepID=A0A0J7XPC6_9SPHN|nr:membrane protein [Novosphingobium barchaimii LL02]
MLDYMLMPFRRYADFRGRSRRMEFWSFTLLNVIVYAVIVILALAMGLSFSAFENLENGQAPSAAFGGGFMVLVGVGGLYALATLVPNIAVAVRRLHDRDMSGWWYLGFSVLGMIPFVGWIASIAFLVILFLPGTPGHNRFGADPKDPSGADVFA